jgi:tetratricopeptide (TPR) repeat protein
MSIRLTLTSLVLASALHAGPRVLARVEVALPHTEGAPAQWLEQLREDPRHEEAATGLVAHLLEEARRSGRAQPLRAARRVLAPWETSTEVPYEVALAQARVHWRLGNLKEAIAGMEALLGAGPDDGRVWEVLAGIQDEQGDYPAAFRRCLLLVGREDPMPATLCIASANRYGTQAPSAGASLEAAMSRGPQPPAVTRRARLVLAEAARTRGDAATAERHLVAARRLDPLDAEVLAALADLWLAQGRAAEVVRLLSPRPAAPELALRRALALHPSDPEAAAREGRQLHAQVANALWGNQPRWAELDARMHLELMDEPDVALKRARVAWAARRSPRSAAVILRAARAAGDEAAIRMVGDWVEAAGVAVPELRELLRPGTR